ncbi:MAG: hypothetical protein Q9M14_05360 [Mariprofundaceae bacterium]|nr:hypothetical protein [Mariprofundaceae bacterium]
MPFNPTEFYEFSSWLNTKLPNTGFQQSVARTIISRAYYAALLNSSDVTGAQTLGGHDGVINALKSKNLMTGNKLYALKMLRQKSDYEKPDVTRSDINKALRDSKSILNYLHKSADLTQGNYLNIS